MFDLCFAKQSLWERKKYEKYRLDEATDKLIPISKVCENYHYHNWRGKVSPLFTYENEMTKKISLLCPSYGRFVT